MVKDLWHFPRSRLAKQVIEMFNTGMSSALVFFAPRRMGKTEFLCKDIEPYAKKRGWAVFYFSFLDAGNNVQSIFTHALSKFAEQIGVMRKKNKILSKIKKIGGEAVGLRAELELNDIKSIRYNLQEIISYLAKADKVLLLLDEVQVLAKHSNNEKFIATLRTALDLHKDNIKVIFTGSSREGLRQMFSQANAPFFHFGQNLPFPEFGPDFTDHLCDVFNKVTTRKLDKKVLWEAFIDLEKVPQLARSLVERLALNPNQTILEAKNQLLTDIYHDRAFIDIWTKASKLEQLLLQTISNNSSSLFSEKTRDLLAQKLGIETLGIPAVQSALRVLQKKGLIGKLPERTGYFIEDPNFKTWLKDHII